MIVYLILNSTNLKGYVGKHKGDKISTRWYRSLAGANRHLAAARDKYGIVVFTREILNVCSSQEEMNNLELYGREKAEKIAKVNGLKSTLRQFRAFRHICYNCYKPFKTPQRNVEQVFCTRKCQHENQKKVSYV